MTSVSVVWSTPDADKLIAYMARVSNPTAKPDDPDEKLIGYLIRKRHWSPFDMCNVCFSISTTRDIARQIMRHWSLKFHELNVQEFSQRYADVRTLEGPVLRRARLQDAKNRQSSYESDDEDLQEWWMKTQEQVWSHNVEAYTAALNRGIAKEQARAVMPEGMTPTLFYLNGTVRQWIHYLALRLEIGTQKEHREVAELIHTELLKIVPKTTRAVEQQDK